MPAPTTLFKDSPTKTTADLFIVDNSDTEWKVDKYLGEWADLARAMDIATGYFEIGALLALDGQWQKLEQIRLLMGDEVTKRTRDTLLKGVRETLDKSIEQEKEANDFLHGVPAIVDALRSEKILARVFAKNKFHAKAYITHSKYSVVGSAALVGSSNFTLPGLTQNVELNLHVTERVAALQEWYEHYWDQSQDITPDLLKTIERHTREYSPFEVYAKALQEFFRGHEITVGEWEQNESKIYKVLDQYQKEGYQNLMKIAGTHHGAFLCDGVGLGKTFIGMMLIERLAMFDRKRVALFVPKAARGPVWEKTLDRYLPHLQGDFSNFVIYNHTDLGRGGDIGRRLERLRDNADVIIIDEAHHFRNPGIAGQGDKAPSRYRRLYDLIGDQKDVFMLTATPVNNRLIDLQHMIELFARDRSNYFKDAPLGIQSLSGHFRKMEKALDSQIHWAAGATHQEAETNVVEAEQVLQSDALFQALVVQRSRAYVKASQAQHGGNQAQFPIRQDPQVADYSIKKTYGHLLDKLDKAFAKDVPLFSLAIYYPLAYYKGSNSQINPLDENRQKAVVGLIRIMFLKRFESSALAFEKSCQTLLLKLLAWVTKNSKTPAEQKILDRWKAQHADLVGYVQQHQLEFGDGDAAEEHEDIVTPEMLENAEELPRDEYKVSEIIAETFLDLDQIAEFLAELSKFKPSHDDKLQALIKLLKSDPVLKKHKVLIFSEFSDTARYLQRELGNAGIVGVDEVDSGSGRDRGDIIEEFAPYYNGWTSGALAAKGRPETRVLIATDVLAEGLNLQDATRLINYDIHWNPVRLMQRIGRVDRRMNSDTEAQIVADHPDQKEIRGTAAYWNFLPPDELDDLLRLYSKVSRKTLKISKTFGIEGRKLLRPEDDFDALKEFNESYNGTTTQVEGMRLEYDQLLLDHPDLADRLKALPGRVFSAKRHLQPGTRAVFFCYALTAPDPTAPLTESGDVAWTEAAGSTRWLLYDLATKQIHDDATAIITQIRSTPQTPRSHTLDEVDLSDARAAMDKHLKDTYLKKVNAPVRVKPILKAWMELS